MTDWPTLDGPDAERAIRDATAAVWTWEEGASAESIVAALNDADVVLCDEVSLIELRRQTEVGEALIADLRDNARGTSPARRLTGDEAARILLSRHGLA